MLPTNKQRWIQCLGMAAILASGFAPAASAIYGDCRQQPDSCFALVIGNSYSNRLSGRLDAEEIAPKLEQLGFSVDLLVDATFEQLEGDPERKDDGALIAFRKKIKAAKEVVFFYSGHGYQLGEENYLVPNDRDFSLTDPQFPLKKVLNALKGAPDEAVKTVFLDACRTPFNIPENLKDQGLAETRDLPPTSLISFAHEYGHAVRSGRGDELSPYSAALARSIREPGLGIYQLLARVSQDVGSIQTPIYHGTQQFPSDYLFKRAIELPLAVADNVNDQLLIFHNGRFVLAASPQGTGAGRTEERSATLELSAGGNELLLMMFNEKGFQDRQPWLPTDGWHYEMDAAWPPGTKRNCVDPCFHGNEEFPFKSGVHHGQIFEVARASIYVDPGTWVVKATVENDLWSTKAPLWARDQKRLWNQSFNQLGLGERPILKELTGFYGVLRNFLRGFKLTKKVDLPELQNLWAQVYGNSLLEEPVTFCMENEREARLDDLEDSLTILLERTNARPFDQFDLRLAACVHRWISDRPTHPFFDQEVRLWTALQEFKPIP